MLNTIKKCDNSDCSFKQSSSAALGIFSQNLLDALNTGVNLSLDINNFEESRQDQVIDSVFNGAIPKELDLLPNVKEILLHFKSLYQCCDCTREKARELMKNDSCLKNCLTYKQANNETIEKKKKEIYQLEQFSGLIKEFSPPSDNITEEDKIYLQLLTRLSSHKKAPHDDMTIDSIINEISLATKAINKCRNCHKEILTIESNVKENNQIIFS